MNNEHDVVFYSVINLTHDIFLNMAYEKYIFGIYLFRFVENAKLV